MKLLVEIKDNKFIYKYKIGLSEQVGDLHLTAENFIVFCKLIQDCCMAAHRDYKEFFNEISARAFFDKNPDKVKEYIDKLAKK